MAGLAYYAGVLQRATDPEIIAFAREFVDEESGHVAELRRWIAARKQGKLAPTESDLATMYPLSGRCRPARTPSIAAPDRPDASDRSPIGTRASEG